MSSLATIAYDGTDFSIDNVRANSTDVFDSSGTYLKTVAFGITTLGEDLSFDYSQLLKNLGRRGTRDFRPRSGAPALASPQPPISQTVPWRDMAGNWLG